MNVMEVLQDYLDKVSACVMTQNWDGYRPSVSLPLHLITATSSMTVTTEAELRLHFDTFAQTLKAQHVTDFIRLAELATEMTETLISCRFVTHLMSNGHRLIPPYRSQMTLRFEDGSWRAASITNSLANSTWPMLMPNPMTTQGPWRHS